MSKLYLIVRSDLPVAQQAIQAAHALQEFNELFSEVVGVWRLHSNTLALLEVPDEHQLLLLAERAYSMGAEVALFREPDLGESLTAIAIGPAGKRLTRGLPLALTPT